MKMKMRPILLNVFSIVFFVCLALPNLNGQNTDSLSLVKESQHFAFYSTKADIGVLDSLAIILEKNYARITNRLGIEIDKKINVKVFPDVKSFHIAVNYPDSPDWVVGSCVGDELLMVSPLNPGSVHSYESLMQVVVHEFVHIAVYYTCGDKVLSALPKWLNEGYAQYEAGQLNDRVRKSVEASLRDKAPNWAQLNAASAMEFGHMNGYAISVSIVEFLVDTYGIDKLVLLIKAPDDLDTIYGFPENTLEEQWVRYVKHENTD
ncbi:MAG: hypothetical protein KJ578_04025 [Bacteroidetes bacterium]|nr:hypothetical protein [Bacteroidota bacterium]MBU1581061.1 hypothetical protein [Bacteroidota bacterium]MBU2556929.1 hypothetical protein [Bacteroidota bacterium]